MANVIDKVAGLVVGPQGPQGPQGPKGDTGQTGPQGATGATGATPNLTMGTVTTLDPDDPATATISGTAENPVLSLGIPKGDTGEVSQAEFDEVAEDVSQLMSDLSEYESIFTGDVDESVQNWLDEHPEATTTVQDGSLTYKKLVTGTLGFVTPEMFGAVGDGIADDTEAVQEAINTKKSVLFSGTYLCDTVYIEDISNVTYLAISGKIVKKNDGTMFRYIGTLKNIIFNGIVSDGSSVSDGAFFFGDSLIEMENVVFINCVIENYTIGVSFNADKSGYIKNITVANCSFKNMRGFNPGFGYGVHMASQHSDYVGGVVYNCKFDNCNRHAIYFARGNGYTAINNRVENHKKDSWNNPESPSISAAINVSRSWNVIVHGNTIVNNHACCIRVSSHLTNEEDGNIYELPEYKANNVIISDNIMEEISTYAMVLGWTDAALGIIGGVTVCNNICDGGVYIGCAERVTLDNNVINGHTGVQQTQAIAVVNKRDSKPYVSYIRISKNTLSTNDTNQRVIRIAASAKDDYLDIFENINLSNYALISAAVDLTNVATIESNSGLSSNTIYRSYSINNGT